jgi:hypothetical protein
LIAPKPTFHPQNFFHRPREINGRTALDKRHERARADASERKSQMSRPATTPQVFALRERERDKALKFFRENPLDYKPSVFIWSLGRYGSVRVD